MSCMMIMVKQIEYKIYREPKQSFPSTKPRPTYRVSPAGAKYHHLNQIWLLLNRVAKS